MSWEYCVVGNGLLGAAVALELSKNTDRVCIVGAKYGDEGVYFSAHEDDSRIARQFHGDVYWERLAERNMVRLHELTQETGSMDVFRSMPVLYRFKPDASPRSHLLKTWKAKDGGGASRSFSHEDIGGGLINPKTYVAALNMAAAAKGAKMQCAAVHNIRRNQSGFEVCTRETVIRAKHVVDARGCHQPNLPGAESAVVGKVTIFVESGSSSAQLHPFCFLAIEESASLRDVYGFHQYRIANGRVISKFGFSEREPVRLPRHQVSDWFRGAYCAHPALDAARAWIGNFLDCAWTSTIKPCAFVSTATGRPHIRYEEGLLSITGCNGMAAKCCQALAEDAVALMWNRE